MHIKHTSNSLQILIKCNVTYTNLTEILIYLAQSREIGVPRRHYRLYGNEHWTTIGASIIYMTTTMYSCGNRVKVMVKVRIALYG